MHPRWHVTVMVVTLGVLLQASAQERPEGTQEPEKQDVHMAAVLGCERPGNTDLLFLRSGEMLSGTILNTEFAIQTPYAGLSFSKRMLAGIDLKAGANNIEAIITVNNSRFSGYISAPVFVFQRGSGTQVEIRREKVLKAVFRMRKDERRGLPQRQFVILKNGDFFSGKILTEQLTLTTTQARLPVELSNTVSIAMAGADRPHAKVLLWNRDTVAGILETEGIDVELDVGPTVSIYRDRIDVLYATEGFVPHDQTIGSVDHSASPVSGSWVGTYKYTGGEGGYTRADIPCELSLACSTNGMLTGHMKMGSDKMVLSGTVKDDGLEWTATTSRHSNTFMGTCQGQVIRGSWRRRYRVGSEFQGDFDLRLE